MKQAHVLVIMVVGYMLAEAPGWANLDGGWGTSAVSGALLALLGASLGEGKGDRLVGRRPILSTLPTFCTDRCVVSALSLGL